MEHNENLQVKAYRLAYDEAFANAENAYNYEQKEAWVAEAVKYAKLIQDIKHPIGGSIMAELTREEWAKRRTKDYNYHVEKCEAHNLPQMDWETYKHWFDSRDTAEENHERMEELMYFKMV